MASRSELLGLAGFDPPEYAQNVATCRGKIPELPIPTVEPVQEKGWTSARQAKQAEAIRTWKPWERSTGPVTVEGKKASAMRGFKGGWRDQMRQLSAAMREQRKALERLR